MRVYLLALACMLLAVPAIAETVTIKTSNERYRVIDAIQRTNALVYTILDTETGDITIRALPLPRRNITLSRRTWDPYAGRYREIIGYDRRSMPVYRDDDHSRVVYWITERTWHGTGEGGAAGSRPSPRVPGVK